MHKLILSVLLIFFGLGTSWAQEAYTISHGGKPSTLAALAKEAAKADVVFFGELHDSPMAHWCQLELYKLLAAEAKAKGKPLAIGMEMLEADDQTVLDEYLKGWLKPDALKAAANLWDNYEADYGPLVEAAKAAGQRVIATNVPRRYASLVARRGLAVLDSVSPLAKAWLPALPLAIDYAQPSYAAMLEMMGGEGHGMPTGTGNPAKQFVAAQALKDATMAQNIAKNMVPNGLFYHLNGSYHSDDREGIIAYLLKLKPKAKIITITTGREGEETKKANEADYVLQVAF